MGFYAGPIDHQLVFVGFLGEGIGFRRVFRRGSGSKLNLKVISNF
jgi:hypothetical protein